MRTGLSFLPLQLSAPEQALRLLVNLLGLERQARPHNIVTYRKSLRDLNGLLARRVHEEAVEATVGSFGKIRPVLNHSSPTDA